MVVVPMLLLFIPAVVGIFTAAGVPVVAAFLDVYLHASLSALTHIELSDHRTTVFLLSD
jgi:putative effector of murein hydrolase LrgA (UPF0299 family)